MNVIHLSQTRQFLKPTSNYLIALLIKSYFLTLSVAELVSSKILFMIHSSLHFHFPSYQIHALSDELTVQIQSRTVGAHN